MGWFQATRVGFALAAAISATAVPSILQVSATSLVVATVAYLWLTAAAEGVRRTGRAPSLWVVGGMLLADGLYLAWVIYSTGGSGSPLMFLPLIHLIAVTLVGSYRTGLKIALWHSLLFFVVYYA